MNFYKALLLLFITCVGVFASDADMPNLPTTPALLLSEVELNSVVDQDTQDAWKELSDSAKKKALELANAQEYAQAGSWIYTSLAAKFFSEDGLDIPPEFKSFILKNLPAFFDYYESWKSEDDIKSSASVLKTIFSVYPQQTKEFLRLAMAISLIYDVSPPTTWPECNVPSNPASITYPQELFYYFMDNSSKMIFPMQKLTVPELVFMAGVAGPMDELRGLLKNNLTPFTIEKLTQSVKTDNSRITRKGRSVTYEPWDTSVTPYTPENIYKNGGTPLDKIFYAWRTANANGIPCIYFSDQQGGKTYSWLAYMSKVGVWKFNIARDKSAVNLYGRPLNPQTWKPLEMFDIEYLCRRAHTTTNGMDSRIFLRLAEAMFESGQYEDATIFAEKSKKADPENWKAYRIHISARARFGAAPNELDALWRKSYEAFRRYPEMCIFMLEGYRQNLIVRNNRREADRLLIAEMRTVMRNDPGLAVEIYSEQIKNLLSKEGEPANIFSALQDILRNASGNEIGCFEKIIKPTSDTLANNNDYKSAFKVVSMFKSSVNTMDRTLESKIKSFEETLKKSQTAKKASIED